jgi:hypothetical protein
MESHASEKYSYPNICFAWKEYKVLVAVVSGYKDIPQLPPEGSLFVQQPACCSGHREQHKEWIVNEPIQIQITKHNSHAVYMSRDLQSFVLKLHDRDFRI